MSKQDRLIIAMLYRMVNEYSSHAIPHAALYAELSAMVRHGYTNERADSIMAQLYAARRG
jgi:hypothetical protein